jgi:hypothetical protein
MKATPFDSSAEIVTVIATAPTAEADYPAKIREDSIKLLIADLHCDENLGSERSRVELNSEWIR